MTGDDKNVFHFSFFVVDIYPSWVTFKWGSRKKR